MADLLRARALVLGCLESVTPYIEHPRGDAVPTDLLPELHRAHEVVNDLPTGGGRSLPAPEESLAVLQDVLLTLELAMIRSEAKVRLHRYVSDIQEIKTLLGP
ncbi:MAG: hypothetical protein JWM47_1534 [Acidimicrobiales bacterium]|nr:hypothetical protein [Acidimicrobiales bacterium]